MGREVRMVPADWQHPKDEHGEFIPMYCESYAEAAAEFMAAANEKGLQHAIDEYGVPEEQHYMPDWPPEQRTHYMMYEDTSEGTPISPAFSTPEELARWLADTGASAFGRDTASYEAWLRVARGGYACSAVITNGVMQSGVEGLAGETP
jgi:non-ribosomal peptide synthetase component F